MVTDQAAMSLRARANRLAFQRKGEWRTLSGSDWITINTMVCKQASSLVNQQFRRE
jgi:hypothetical protein